jgi:hypothetical protein
VHAIVHGSKDNSRRCVCNVRVPTVEQYRNVMVPMQEHEFLLVNDDE